MNCRSVQHWLLEVDTLVVKDWPRDMNRHLKRCAGCAQLARDLYQLEEAWREAPVPELCASSKAAFLEKLADPVKSKEFEIPEEVLDPEELRKLDEAQQSGEIRPPSKRATAKKAKKAKQATPPVPPVWQPLRWAPLAAAVLIGIGVLTYMFIARPNQARASADIVDNMVDWNASLSNATDVRERKRLFDDYEPSFRTELKRAVLAPEDSELADDLLKTGRQLASSTDPIRDAEIVYGLQDKLLSRAERADKAGNQKELERSASRYSRFVELGVKPMKSRMDKFMFVESKKGGPDKGGKGITDKSGTDKGPTDKSAADKGPTDKSTTDKTTADKGNKGGPDMAQKMRFDRIMERAPEIYRYELHIKIQTFGTKKGFGPPSKYGPKR